MKRIENRWWPRLALTTAVILAAAGCELDWQSREFACAEHNECADGWSCSAESICVQASEPTVVDDMVTTYAGETIVVDILANDSSEVPLELSLNYAGLGVVLPDGTTSWMHWSSGEYTTYYQAHWASYNRSVSGAIHFSVLPNDLPTAGDRTISVPWNQDSSITFPAGDPNQDQELSFHIELGPEHGELEGTGPTFVYRPDPGFLGMDAIRYHVRDGIEASDAGRIDIEVRCAVLADDSHLMSWDEVWQFDPLANDEVASDAVLSVYSPVSGYAELTGDNQIRYWPKRGEAGIDTFNYRIDQPGGCYAVGQVTVEIEHPIEPLPSPAQPLRQHAANSSGHLVAFTSADASLVAGDDNGVDDVFVWDRQAGTVERVSVSSDGQGGNAASDQPHISGDGRFVVFVSQATNLTVDAVSGHGDVFLHDRQTGTTELVSAAYDGSASNLESSWPQVSDDGRYVGFASVATNLLASDDNQARDVFVRDRQAATTERVSVASDGTPTDAGCDSRAFLSADGNQVAFLCDGSALGGDGDGYLDAFLRDRSEGTTTLLRQDADELVFARGGRFVLLENTWLVDVSAGTTTSVGNLRQATISDNGRFIAYRGFYSNTLFVLDRQDNVVVDIYRARDGSVPDLPAAAALPFISADGRVVVFHSSAALAPDAGPGLYWARQPLLP